VEYRFNAGILEGFFSWFRQRPHARVQEAARGKATAAAAEADVEAAAVDPGMCPAEYRALSEKERVGVMSKVQASACVGATCCEHGLVGRGSIVYANSGMLSALHLAVHI
jgi:hypothetical protein